jgi:hypothetical protein
MHHHQVFGHRQKSTDLLPWLSSFSDDNARHYGLFVDIQTGTLTVNDFHALLLDQLSLEDVFPVKSLPGVFSNLRETTVQSALRHPSQIGNGLDGTNYKPTFCRRDNLSQGYHKLFSLFTSDAAAS